LTTRNKGEDILQDLNYTYDPVGNITRIVDEAQQTFYFNNSVIEPVGTYQYDALYRLTHAEGREFIEAGMPNHNDFTNSLPLPFDGSAIINYNEAYQYDELGNINTIGHHTNGGINWTRDYHYDKNTNYLLNHNGGNKVYDYDDHGNTTMMPHLERMNWDYADRLQYADLGGGGEVYYVYDASGERVRKVIENHNIKEERFYLGGYEVYSKTNNGTVEEQRETLHVYDGTKSIALIETEPETKGGTKAEEDTKGEPPEEEIGKITIRYQYDNHLGSASLELDENAEIISYEEYHPFGTTSYRSGRSETEVSLKRYKYIGKERDNETGLYYYGARYYSAWICRWISTDPAGFVDGLNMYAYVRNNPLKYSDPTGMQSEDEVHQVKTEALQKADNNFLY